MIPGGALYMHGSEVFVEAHAYPHVMAHSRPHESTF